MSADDSERDQRLGVYLVWGVLVITFLGMLPLLIGVGGGPIPVLLLAAFVVVLAKVSADALADGSPSPDAPEDGFQIAGDPIGARGDDADGADPGEPGTDRGESVTERGESGAGRCEPEAERDETGDDPAGAGGPGAENGPGTENGSGAGNDAGPDDGPADRSGP